MADEPPPAKVPKLGSKTLPECPYGARCYRKNPQHFQEFSHSGDSSGTSVDSVSVSPTPTLSTDVGSGDQLPVCKYGIKCYRKNLLHFAEFSHPTSGPSNNASDSDGDTDVYDSSDGEKPDEKADAEKKNNISKDLSLVNRFSQMTEQERKDLIKHAMEEKHRLQQELDGTKKIVEEKNKELEHLQKQMNSGLLMIEGEEEALKKSETTYFPLMPERAYKEGSASQIHFRLAESQFYRLMTGNYASQVRVTKVEYVVSPKVVKRFREYQAELKKGRGEGLAYPVLGFHGTAEKNINLICEKGFKTPGDSGFTHKTDTGFYGAGVYFSEYPSYSMGYIQGCSKLMLCQVLAGKVYECKKLIMGASLVKGYDSHMSPCKKELVIFNSAAILPCYVIYFTNAKTEFKYVTTATKKPVVDHSKIVAATASAGSKIFKGLTFALAGKFSNTQKNLYALIEKHGGSKGTRSNFNIIVASDLSCLDVCKSFQQAKDNSIPVVYESYLYDCIGGKKKLPTADFEVDG